jgi:hypothetical protein
MWCCTLVMVEVEVVDGPGGGGGGGGSLTKVEEGGGKARDHGDLPLLSSVPERPLGAMAAAGWEG